MSEPWLNLILGTNTLEELRIILNVWTKEIDIDEVILPMRDIPKLSSRSKIKWAQMANNSVTNHEPKSTLKATKRVVKILDAKFEKQISMQLLMNTAGT